MQSYEYYFWQGFQERKPLRIKGFDYASDAFHAVTICTKDRKEIFGYISGETMYLSPLGKIVETCWYDLPNHFPYAELDVYQIMPDHIHGIVHIDHTIPRARITALLKKCDGIEWHGKKRMFPGAGHVRDVRSGNNPDVSGISNVIGHDVWQYRFYSQIINGERMLNNMRAYIRNNPKNGKSSTPLKS